MRAYSYGAKAENAYGYFVDDDARELMRSAGVSESHISGEASDFEKFSEFCGIIPFCAGNQVREVFRLRAKAIGLDVTAATNGGTEPNAEKIWRFCTDAVFPCEPKAQETASVVFLRDMDDFVAPNPFNVKQAKEHMDGYSGKRAVEAANLLSVQTLRQRKSKEAFVVFDGCSLTALLRLFRYLEGCPQTEGRAMTSCLTVFGRSAEDMYCAAEIGRRFGAEQGMYWSADMRTRVAGFSALGAIGKCRTLLTDSGAEIKREILEKIISDLYSDK